MDPLQLFIGEYVLRESSNLMICNTLGVREKEDDGGSHGQGKKMMNLYV